PRTGCGSRAWRSPWAPRPPGGDSGRGHAAGLASALFLRLLWRLAQGPLAAALRLPPSLHPVDSKISLSALLLPSPPGRGRGVYRCWLYGNFRNSRSPRPRSGGRAVYKCWFRRGICNISHPPPGRVARNERGGLRGATQETSFYVETA